MTDPVAIIHVGAPKCGSSALQTALSLAPVLRDGAGRRLVYTASQPLLRNRQIVVEGHLAALTAWRSPFGYVSWPNEWPRADNAALRNALHRRLSQAARGRGPVPILSSEGWITPPAALVSVLAELGHPPVAVTAFLRPPVAWLNAAWWQWGVWAQPSLDDWMARQPHAGFTQGLALERWAAIPNVALRVQSTRPDVIAKFAALHGLDLPRPRAASNSQASAALVGLMLRHRGLRPGPHNSRLDFIVQRWCPPVAGPSLWAVMARHRARLAPSIAANRAALARALRPDDLADVLAGGGWDGADGAAHRLPTAAPVLHRRDLARALCAALAQGVARAEAGQPAPALPDPPAPGAMLGVIDAQALALVARLRDADARHRAHAAGAAGALARRWIARP